jgi:uncharacterized protein HemY
MMKKPRSDSKLDTLTPESRVCELRDMLLAGASQAECKGWLLETCGVTTTGDALTRFWRKHCKPIKDEERQLAAVKAEGIIQEAGRTDWNAGTLELVRQVSFEMMSRQSVDPETAEKFIKLVLKADAQEQAREKLKAATKSKIEEGLEALFAEIKGNRKAEEIFKQLREVVKTA